MTHAFHNVLVLHCPTGESFTHQNYCESPARAIELARLTFTAAIWHVSTGVGQASPPASSPGIPARCSTDQLSLL